MIIRNRLEKKQSGRALILPIMLILFTLSAGADGQNRSSYEKIKAKAFTLWDQQDTTAAYRMFESAMIQFPKEQYEISRYLIDLALIQGKYQRMLRVWEEGLERGDYYFIHLHSRKKKEKLRSFRKYDFLMHRNRELIARAQKKSRPVLDLVLPEQYSEQKRYPVYIFLHGYGRNNRLMKRWFTAPSMRREYIIVFFQSSTILGKDAFGWKIGERSRQDIVTCYRELLKNPLVDPDRIVIGGMSIGGTIAIDVALNRIIPVRGFIVNCPAKLQPSLESLRTAKQKGVKGLIITGERDFNLPAQEKLMDQFKKAGFPCEILIQPKLGHHFSQDFSHKVYRGLLRINR